MKQAGWTYELAPTGAASAGLEDYEARTADAEHVGVVVGAVRGAEGVFVLVDTGAMPPFVHRRIAVPWEDVGEIDHASLVVQLAVDREGLDEDALALDPKKAVHKSGADAVRAELPAALVRPVVPGTGPEERNSVLLLGALAAAAPFSLFVLITVWIARGLEGWEYALLMIPFVLAALTVALEGYRLYREPHLGRGSRIRALAAPRRRPAG
jgi:hypothetical protein